jgi:hypothetical protein
MRRGSSDVPARRLPFTILGGAWAMALPCTASASLFQGETLDALADYISWAVLVIAPIVGIAAFWLVHILPEKVAEKKRHPQAKAIQTLCLLSLVFGGLLWPLAWLWAYSKPVFYRAAYGTDVSDEGHDGGGKPPDAKADDTQVHVLPASDGSGVTQEEVQRLREQLDRMGQRVPTAAEVESARARLAAIESATRTQRGG